MRQLLAALCILLFTISCRTQSPTNAPAKVTHILTPFNGMKSGFRANGKPNHYFAQVIKLQGIGDFASINGIDSPPDTFGYIEFEYAPAIIQTRFTLPPNRDFNVTLTVRTNVDNSYFNFSINKTYLAQTVAGTGVQTISVSFKGNPTGRYDLFIKPMYKNDYSIFYMTQLKLETI